MNSKHSLQRTQKSSYDSAKKHTQRVENSISHQNYISLDGKPADILRLQKSAGNRAVSGLIQAKLYVGPFKDVYEQQAERVADQVLQSPDSARPAHKEIKPPPGHPSGESDFIADEKLEQRLHSLRGRGQTMPGELRREMEEKLGADFSEVRLHTNHDSVQLNRRLSSRAFTRLNDIYLNSSEYSPTSLEGRRLLAHELTHVVQQTGKKPAAHRQGTGAILEKEHSAHLVTAIGRSGDSGVVQRYYDEEIKPVDGGYAGNFSEEKGNASSLNTLNSPSAESFGIVPENDADGDIEDFFRSEGITTYMTNQGQSYVPDNAGVLQTPIDYQGPEPLKLPEKYQDEDKKYGWRAYQNVHPSRIRDSHRKVAENTHVITKYFDDKDRKYFEVSPNSKDREKRIYAMDRSGRIITGSGNETIPGSDVEPYNLRGKRMSKRPQEIKEHHSSIFAGQPVAHAGHISIKDGKINYLDDDSGHYRPGAAHTWAAYNLLKARGMLADNGTVTLVNKSIEKGLNQANVAKYERAKLELPNFAYEQTEGNEGQARKKNLMQAYFRNRRLHADLLNRFPGFLQSDHLENTFD